MAIYMVTGYKKQGKWSRKIESVACANSAKWQTNKCVTAQVKHVLTAQLKTKYFNARLQCAISLKKLYGVDSEMHYGI